MVEKNLNETHEMVLLTHLEKELKYADYQRLNLRNLTPLREEVKDRILKLANKE
jgi:hypothetical protein